jgi:hypothetical protein
MFMPYVNLGDNGFSSQKPGFNPRTVHVGFLAKVALGQVYPQVLQSSLANHHETLKRQSQPES